MLRQLWDDWVVGCQRVAVLDAEVMPCGRGKGKHCVITFGVSPLLLGIMGIKFVLAGELLGIERTWWVDENTLMREEGTRGALSLVNTTSGEKSAVRKGVGLYNSNLRVNRDWVFQLAGQLISVGSMKTGELEDPVVTVALPDVYTPEKLPFGLSRVIPSMAVMAVVRLYSKRFYILVIDVAKTYKSRMLCVVSETPCDFRGIEEWAMESVLVMQNKAGQNVFIFDITQRWESKSVVISILENGEMNELYSHKIDCILVQVSGSMFAVYNRKEERLDIWDSNDTTKRHPVIKCIPKAGNDNFVVGGGLIVLLDTDTQHLQVIDASSTHTVVTFGISGWLITDVMSDTSFLCCKPSALRQTGGNANQ
ncbi:hypothetical protein Pelo_19054 [Pelomyxa schiedti]|nr:hypothetical protein Pelo_19054 [Pelomyxa schiedti]